MKEGVPVTISKKSMKWIPWLLVLPVVIIRGFTTLYPILMTVRNSFFDIKILSGINEFCGIQNYLKIFSDPKVLTSIRFTVIFVVVSMIFHVILGVGLALILNMKFKGRRFLRTIVLIPWAMPAVVVGMAAKWAFNNDYGLINDFIRLFVHGYQNSWLINTGSARAAVIAVDLWKDLPFFAILVLSGLQFISGDIYEAAKVDGANKFQTFIQIVLPLVMPGIVATAIYTFINAWNEFLYSLILINSTDKMTVSVALKSLQGAEILNWGDMMAASALVVVPSVIFFMFIQNKIAGGMTEGAVK